MKRYFSVISLLLLTGISFSIHAGAKAPGFVRVMNNITGLQVLSASLSAGQNGSGSYEYVFATVYPSMVRIDAQDAEGDIFYCAVTATDYAYEQIRQAALHFNNGSYINIVKKTNSSVCSSGTIYKDSRFLY